MSFWYNVDTGQVETDDNRSRGEQVLGPYATEAEAQSGARHRPQEDRGVGRRRTAPGDERGGPATRTSWTTDRRAAGARTRTSARPSGKAPDSTSAAYARAASSSVPRRSAYFLTKRGALPLRRPAKSLQTSTCASVPLPAPMPMVGMREHLGDPGRDGRRHHLEDDGEGAGVLQGPGLVDEARRRRRRGPARGSRRAGARSAA